VIENVGDIADGAARLVAAITRARPTSIPQVAADSL
jgi:hypothetical protein